MAFSTTRKIPYNIDGEFQSRSLSEQPNHNIIVKNGTTHLGKVYKLMFLSKRGPNVWEKKNRKKHIGRRFIWTFDQWEDAPALLFHISTCISIHLQITANSYSGEIHKLYMTCSQWKPNLKVLNKKKKKRKALLTFGWHYYQNCK